ncbi:MAG: LuxR C-terminal-related transcriptional regulator [Acidimicrobiales bacterium]
MLGTAEGVVTIGAARALTEAGCVDEAERRARIALAENRLARSDVARLRVARSELLFAAGRAEEALHDAEAALGEPDLPVGVAGRAQLARFQAMMARPELEDARRPAGEILAGGGRPGGDAALPGALAVLGALAWTDGRPSDALVLQRAAIERADAGAPPAWRAAPRLQLAVMLAGLGYFDEAEEETEAAATLADVGGERFWAPAPMVVRANLGIAAGRIDEAEADATAGLVLASQIGALIFIPMARAALALAHVLRGDLDGAAGLPGDQRHELPPPPAILGSAAWWWAEIRVAEAKRGPAGAVEVLRTMGDEVGHRLGLLTEEPAAGAFLVRAAVSLGERRLADSLVAECEHLASRNDGLDSLSAAALHARGVCSADASALESAAARHRHPWARASALEDAGLAFRNDGRRQEAERLFRQSEGVYQEVGAERDAARLRRRLRQVDSPRRRRRAEGPGSGWASLTDHEREVARLVAEGLTNAQVAAELYLSPHTVDFHLRQIYRKLNIRTRVQLTRAVLARSSPAAFAG